MARGYEGGKIRDDLIQALSQHKTGLTGTEIAKKLKINRVTMSKYLKVFAAEGLIRQKKIGSVNLWFIEEGIDQLNFPEDLFLVKNKYLEYVMSWASHEAHNLIRTSLHSGVNTTKLVSEVIIPCITAVKNSADNGKIGQSEKNFLDEIISTSVAIIRLSNEQTDPGKNIVILSTDYRHLLYAQAAAAAFQSDNWKVSLLGDMSSAIDVLFDIDLQKFLNKIWQKREGIMIIAIFSSNEREINFFSQAIHANKTKLGRNFYLALCSDEEKELKNADFVSDNIGTLIQWSQTVFERNQD